MLDKWEIRWYAIIPSLPIIVHYILISFAFPMDEFTWTPHIPSFKIRLSMHPSPFTTYY